MSKISPSTSQGVSSATPTRGGTSSSLPTKNWRPASVSTEAIGGLRWAGAGGRSRGTVSGVIPVSGVPGWSSGTEACGRVPVQWRGQPGTATPADRRPRNNRERPVRPIPRAKPKRMPSARTSASRSMATCRLVRKTRSGGDRWCEPPARASHEPGYLPSWLHIGEPASRPPYQLIKIHDARDPSLRGGQWPSHDHLQSAQLRIIRR